MTRIADAVRRASWERIIGHRWWRLRHERARRIGSMSYLVLARKYRPRSFEEISLLLDQAVYKPVVGRFKVYMIDEVHMLSTTAFNAMLKTLEEPPEYLKFVLATTDPQKVPPTVLSRCLQFNLRPMAPQTVQEHLVTVLAHEQIAAEPGALRLLARAARGAPGGVAGAGRDAARLQHRAARPRRTRPRTGRLQRADDGAAASARVPPQGQRDHAREPAGRGARPCTDAGVGRGTCDHTD